jgi:hypothetical protein
MPALRLFERRLRLRPATFGGDSKHARRRAEQDRAFAVPRAAGKSNRRADLLRRTACRLDFFQTVSGDESDPPAVR